MITKQCGHLCHRAVYSKQPWQETLYLLIMSHTYFSTKVISLAFFELLCVIQNGRTNFISLIAFNISDYTTYSPSSSAWVRLYLIYFIDFWARTIVKDTVSQADISLRKWLKFRVWVKRLFVSSRKLKIQTLAASEFYHVLFLQTLFFEIP